MQDRRVIAAIAFVAISVLSDANANDVSSVQRGQETSHQVDAAQTAKSLSEEVIVWISANFDLPAKSDRPQIRFATQSEMMRIRIADRMRWRGYVQEEPAAENERNVVAIYDTSSRTIYLPENWRGESPADQSILVHEMVHHLQNLAGVKFECPAAREKAAYLAQDKWLARIGKSLESDFDVDMFTVVISSACM
jgi:uncharacterized protein DUF6647